MSSSHLRVITTPFRLGAAALSPVAARKANAEACDTPLSRNKTIRRRLLQFPSPRPVVSSPRLSSPNTQITIRKYDERASTSAEVQRTHLVPSVSTPDRDHFFKHGLDNLKQCNVLGRGTFGVVIEAKYKDKNVAVKIVPKKTYQSSIKIIENGKNALGLQHPNIINTLNVINNHNSVGLIIMDKIFGISLQEQLEDISFKLNDSQRLGYALDISHGIEFCHGQRILHLDIQPKNILVCFVTNTCKLCNFGNSIRIVPGKTIEGNKNLNMVLYTAPEILKGKGPTCASDIYSFGITLWQMQYRKVPFSGYDSQILIYKVCNSQLRPESSQPSNKYEKLYHRCWHQEPSLRPHLKDVIKQLNKLKGAK